LTGSSETREALLAGMSAGEVADRFAPVPLEWRDRVLECEARVQDRARA
jgi:hypothetical protein